MMEAKTILEMIEAVDPSDTEKLDEIDARVWCYLHGYIYAKHNKREVFKLCADTQCELPIKNFSDVKNPTRSRDALKAIRPDWKYTMTQSPAVGYRCYLQKEMHTPNKSSPAAESPWYRRGAVWGSYGSGFTEELAELHAIIQAIKYERGKQ